MNLSDLPAAKNIDPLPHKLADEMCDPTGGDLTRAKDTPGDVFLWRVRTFATGERHITGIITSRHDDDASLTTAAEYALRLLQRGWPQSYIRVIEHQAPPRETFDELFPLPHGLVGRRRIPLTVIYSEFGHHLIDG